MVCICIFQVYRLGEQPKDYLILSNEIMFLFGTGFKSIIPKRISSKRKRIAEYIIDETLIKVGSQYIWLWVAIEPRNRQILALSVSKERNMFIAEKYLSALVKVYGKHPVSTDGGTWYPMACQFLKLDHHIHSALEKSLIERKMQYIKDRTENFDDYFPCRIKNCKLKHVQNWLRLFVDYYNNELKPVK